MANFFDLQPDRQILSIHEYIQSISNPIKRNMVEVILSIAQPILHLQANNLGVQYQAPEIRIVMDPSPGAEGMSGRIALNSGLIDHCLAAMVPVIDEVIGTTTLSERIRPAVFHQIMIGWVLAHEQAHVLRKHSDVIEKVGNSIEVMQALEYDADLCATAAIYRCLSLEENLSDIEVRRVVLFGLFWTLRSLEMPRQQQTHLPLVARLMGILIKLTGMLPTNDPRVPGPENHRLLEILSPDVRHSELYFQKLPEGKHHNIDLLHAWPKMIEEGTWSAPGYTWDWLREIVARISGTRC